MMKLVRNTICAAALFSSPALAQSELNVVAPWSNLHAYEAVERPFWSDELPKLTEGALTARVSNYSELGLSGAELLRLAT
ncbi:transporter, partial [Rhizobiaceae sp. 2RAB30]